MSIARGTGLKNSYKYLTVAIDSCQGERPCGVVYHASHEKGNAFDGYWELACSADGFFQGKDYPMRNMEQRTFFNEKEETETFIQKIQPATEEVRDGKKATFQLHISQRYNTNWQGRLLWQEQQKTYEYKSFLELIHIMNGILTDGADSSAADSIFAFNDMNELIGKLDVLFSMPNSGTTVVGIYQGAKKRRATFGIRLLFRENATWQGSIFWKETKRQRYFRSFQELMRIVDTAIESGTLWTEHNLQRAIAI